MSTNDPTLPGHLFVGIDHIGVAVPDLDEAIAFYRDTFGMEVTHQEANEDQGVREAMLRVGDAGRTDGVGVLGEQPAPCIQLLAPLTESSPIVRFLDRSGPGLQQIAYRVLDVEHVSAVLRSRGLRVLYDTPRRGTADSRINFVHPKDTGGVLIELVQPAGASATTT
ncbi:MAG: methylmalonyl-CoA epimerase [Nocardioidaceae bacterium]|nr:methylmalonyl-CoA epimerase [Nocardioidaceae bacterium]